MRKLILTTACALILTACGESDERKSYISKEKSLSNWYSIDGFTGEYDLNELLMFTSLYVNAKTYTVNVDKKLYISYQNLPIFKTEVQKQIITPTKLLSTKSQHLGDYKYLIGKDASFDGKEFKYTLSNNSSLEPLRLSWNFNEIDVSGRLITDDMNNPIHRIKKGLNAEILAAILGLGYTETDVFPTGAVCWQKKSAKSNIEYIDYYPERIIRHVSDENKILRKGKWNDVDWIEFSIESNNSELANIKLEIGGKVYWGFYHSTEETLKSDGLSCDFMNEIAYTAIMPKLDKFNEQFKTESSGMDIGYMWWPLYLDRDELNPYIPEADIEENN